MHKVEASDLERAGEIGDLRVEPEVLVGDHEAGSHLGVRRRQTASHREPGVVGLSCREDDLEARVVLREEALEILLEFVLEPLDGLEHADRRQVGAALWRRPQMATGRPERDQVGHQRAE